MEPLTDRRASSRPGQPLHERRNPVPPHLAARLVVRRHVIELHAVALARRTAGGHATSSGRWETPAACRSPAAPRRRNPPGRLGPRSSRRQPSCRLQASVSRFRYSSTVTRLASESQWIRPSRSLVQPRSVTMVGESRRSRSEQPFDRGTERRAFHRLHQRLRRWAQLDGIDRKRAALAQRRQVGQHGIQTGRAARSPGRRHAGRDRWQPVWRPASRNQVRS